MKRLVWVLAMALARIAGAQASAGDVVVERWDINTPGIFQQITGIIKNNTDFGVYNIQASFTLRDAQGKVVSAFKVSGAMGRPANIPGESYYSTQQTPDYLPPKSRGYFATYGCRLDFTLRDPIYAALA